MAFSVRFVPRDKCAKSMSGLNATTDKLLKAVDKLDKTIDVENTAIRGLISVQEIRLKMIEKRLDNIEAQLP